MAALSFGAVLEHAGMLERIVAPAVGFARSTVALVATAIGMNIVAGDQYIAVVLPGPMFKSRVRAARLRASPLVAHDRRLRHGNFAAGAVEQLRRLYVGDARGLRLRLSALRLFQSPEPADDYPRGVPARPHHGSFSSAGRAVQDLIVEGTKNAPSRTAWSRPSSGGWIRNLQR